MTAINGSVSLTVSPPLLIPVADAWPASISGCPQIADV
jgi:hypothetical protein